LSKKKSARKATGSKRKSPKREALNDVGNSSRQSTPPIDEQIRQLVTFLNDLREFAGQVKADVESFRFGVEKQKEGVTVDTLFRASIRSD
jgi:hypothetical protein